MKRRFVAGAVGHLLGFIGGGAVIVAVDDSSDQSSDVSGAATATTTVEPCAGDDMIVFLQREVTEQERRDLEDVMAADTRIGEFRYVDEEESAEEFRRIFGDNQAMLDRLAENPGLLPTSYRIEVSQPSAEKVAAVAADIAAQTGVLRASPSTQWDPDLDEIVAALCPIL